MNVIDLLKTDHRVVDALFREVESTPESKHKALFKTIKGELEAHAHVEETIFYPRLKKDGDQELNDITDEGIEEHHQMHMFLDEMSGISGDTFEAKFKVLIEDVRHHVMEEEGEMFPLVEDQFDKTKLELLGKT